MNSIRTRLKKHIVRHSFDVCIHLFMITGFLYAAFELLVVFHIPGQGFILFQNASQVDFNILTIRRLYAIESWVIFSGYVLYLGQRKRIWGFEKHS